MSIYSGFGTRSQEESYNKALYNSIYLVQLKLLKEYKGGKQSRFTPQCLQSRSTS